MKQRNTAVLSLILLALILLATIVAGCGGGENRRYTIEEFMGNDLVSGGVFSHDESRILFTSDNSGIFNIYSAPVGGGEAVQLTDSGMNSIFALSYFPEDDRILYLSDEGGNEIHHIYMRDLDGSVRDLTPWKNAKSVFYGWTSGRDQFIFGSNKRDQRFMDIYMMDKKTLEPRMIYLNDAGYSLGAMSNDDRYLAFTRIVTEHNSEMYLYDRETGATTHLSPHEGEVNFLPNDFSPDSRYLYYLTDEGSEYLYVKRIEIGTGASETVEKAQWDIVYSHFSWQGKYKVTGINNDGSTEIKVCDAASGAPVELPDLPGGEITAIYFSRSDRYMRFYHGSARSPTDIHVYDFQTRKSYRITNSLNPAIDRDDLVDAQVVRYRSFDGEVIPANYYKPKNIKPGDSIPAIVHVHGGPGGQARKTYSDALQYFINHGYAVLSVNNRGSSGYGKRFRALDDMRHGQDDLRDCIEGKNWLVMTGYVDPDRIAIMGASYGGYMALAALTFAPEEFAAGVDLFGITNWLRNLQSLPAWRESYREAMYREMGHPERDAEYLRSISPLFHAERITKPLMVLQGWNDPQVLKAESDEIVKAARDNGAQVEYMIFEDEGHGFLKRKNRMAGYGAILEFLDRHLKEDRGGA